MSTSAATSSAASSESSNLAFATTIMEQTQIERKRNEEELQKQREEIASLRRQLEDKQHFDASQPSTSRDPRAYAASTRKRHDESTETLPPMYDDSIHQIKRRRRHEANREAKYLRLTGRPAHTYVPIKVEPADSQEAPAQQREAAAHLPQFPVIDLTVSSDEEGQVKEEQQEEAEPEVADPLLDTRTPSKPAEILWDRPKDRIEQYMSLRSAAFKIYEEEYMNEEPDFDGTLTKAPSANTSKRKPGKRAPRPAWIYIPRRWALTHFLTYLIGDSNIRYRNQTFCSICHHVTSDWDTHPLCAQ